VIYSQKVMEHFKNPRNMGKIEDYDGLGKIQNEQCGDMMYVYIKVKKIKDNEENKEILADIKVQTFGCAAAIACASAMTELMKDKTLDEGMCLKREDITNYLDGLPSEKVHCSNLSADALHAAIKDYRSRKATIQSKSRYEKEIESTTEEIEKEYKKEEEKDSEREDYSNLDKEWEKFSKK